jgi:hypothetical protein
MFTTFFFRRAAQDRIAVDVAAKYGARLSVAPADGECRDNLERFTCAVAAALAKHVHPHDDHHDGSSRSNMDGSSSGVGGGGSGGSHRGHGRGGDVVNASAGRGWQGFDWFAATAFLVCGGRSQEAARWLEDVATADSGTYVWHAALAGSRRLPQGSVHPLYVVDHPPSIPPSPCCSMRTAHV